MAPPKLQWLGPPAAMMQSSFASRIAARVFSAGELLVDGIAVIGRAAHVGERDRLVELGAHGLPRLRPERTTRLIVHAVNPWSLRARLHPAQAGVTLRPHALPI